MTIRPIKQISRPTRTTDGAGVELNRVFSHDMTDQTDPFLLLDHFYNPDPSAVSPGFPWHPHRGIETITYLIDGGVKHEDSLGNKGILKSGDVQWMTAGSGIIHQEMPPPDSGNMGHGFQLWANLPSAKKMTAPRYQDIPSSEIPEETDDDGTKARIITGDFWGKKGPVTGIATNPRYLDITIPPNTVKTIKVETGQHAFAYIFEGNGAFRGASKPIAAPTEYVTVHGISEAVPAHPIENRTLVLFDRGDEIHVETRDTGMRFLLVSGQPLKEPIAWYGPIVMNTQEELRQAFEEYQNGTFIK